MLIYSVLMFLIAILFALISIAVYRGRTDLIHAYHQTKVTDKRAYGRAFGKGLAPFSAAPLFSGIIGLLGDSDGIAMTAVAVLFIGLCVGMGCIVAVQKKYNNGLF